MRVKDSFINCTTIERHSRLQVLHHGPHRHPHPFILRLLASCIAGTSRLPHLGYIDESSRRAEGHSPFIRSHPLSAPHHLPTTLPWPCSDDRRSRGRTMTPSALQTSPTLDLSVLYPHHRGCCFFQFDLCAADADAAYPAAAPISRDQTCTTTHLVLGSPKRSDCNIWQVSPAVRRSPGGTLRLKGRRPCPRPRRVRVQGPDQLGRS